MKFRIPVLSLILILICIYTTQAQRPKVGLVLSGGGAKGLSHVGILQAIDSAGLHIDYITGTSMGAIVGAMYATGYSANQIDSISKSLNWDVLLSGKPKYTDVGMDEKDEYGKYSFEIPMKGFKSQMGTGLIESEEVWLQFSEIFFHVYDQKDFSKFAIPFKCIATDLSNGKPVVLENGELVKALRSSMAIPSVFSAVEHNDTYLVDGGIVRNFPVSDVKEMGADYTIGVNLFSGLPDAKKLNSALDVMYQITNFRDADDLVEEKKICDFLIEPPLEGYSAGSFSEADKILEIGNQMREKYYPYFKQLADSLNNIYPAQAATPKRKVTKQKTVIIDDYEIVGLENLKEEVLLEKANVKDGMPLTAAAINDAFREIYSTLYFKYVYYELIPTSEGHAKMIIRVKEQPQEYFKFAFSYHSFSAPAIYLNYTMRNLLFNKSRTLVKVGLSQDMKALLEHKQFFGHQSNNSFTFALRHLQQRINLFDNDEVTSQYKTANSEIEIRYNYYLTRHSSLGINLAYRNSTFSPKIASTFRFDGYSRNLSSRISFEVNKLNRPFVPTNGIEASFNLTSEFNRKLKSTYGEENSAVDSTVILDNQEPLLRFDFHVNMYKALTSRTTLLANVQGGHVFTGESFYLNNMLVGGNQKLYKNQFMFVGYQDAQLVATSLTSGLLGIQYRAISELYLIGKANVGFYNFTNESGLVNDIEKQFISGFSAGIAYNLSALPFELSANYSPEIGAVYSHIRIGFIF